MIVDCSFLVILSEKNSETLSLSVFGVRILWFRSAVAERAGFSLPVVFITASPQNTKSLQFFMPIDKLSFSLDQQIWPHVNFIS
jgi:hypothetical protein